MGHGRLVTYIVRKIKIYKVILTWDTQVNTYLITITADDTGEDAAEHISNPNLVFLVSYLIKITADDTGEDAAEHFFCRLYWSISERNYYKQMFGRFLQHRCCSILSSIVWSQNSS